jgi:hypothetical protein
MAISGNTSWNGAGIKAWPGQVIRALRTRVCAIPPSQRPVSRSGRSMVANDLIVIVIDPGSYQEPFLAG